MFNKIKIGLCSFALASLSCVAAEEWKLSLGVTYRTFDDISMHGLTLGDGSKYLDGDDDGSNPISPVDQVTPPSSSFPLLGEAVSLHRANYTGASDELDSGTGLVFGASKQMDNGFGFELSFVYIDTSFDEGVNADTYTDVFYGGVPGGSDEFGDMPPGGKTADVQIRYDMDVTLYTFGAGISKTLQIGAFDMKFSGGPTITIADFDMSYVATQSFTGIDDVNHGSGSDDGIDLLLGAYVAADLSYDFNENWGMALGLRYDLIVNEIESDIADIDASGLSVELKVTYQF